MKLSARLVTRIASVRRCATTAAVAAQEQCSSKTEEPYHRTFDGDSCHVNAINAINEKTVLRLKLPEEPLLQHTPRYFKLPDDAVEGLMQAILETNQPPKQLQHEADQLADKLASRRFPASFAEMSSARNEVKNEMRAKGDLSLVEADMFNAKVKRTIDKHINTQAARLLRKKRYNWEPLEFDSKVAAVRYALACLPSHYAEVRRVLHEFDKTGFVPSTVLDFGSGIGGAIWAVNDLWGEKIDEYYAVDASDHATEVAMDILRGRNYTTTGEPVNKKVIFRRAAYPSQEKKYDLVIVHRTLIEIKEHEARVELIADLWKKTNKYLVIIEGHMPDCFKAVMEARDYVLTAGVAVEREVLTELLGQHDLLHEEMKRFLDDKRISPQEKYEVVREKLPTGVAMPTTADPGFVFAPCPHDLGCPKLAAYGKEDACTLSARWRQFRADNSDRDRRNDDGNEHGKFTYVIMEKGSRPERVVDSNSEFQFIREVVDKLE
ncbi:false p73 target protein [Aphelenchoides avenae]|nr:false p73 target protein [Aphelenchus avenae]